MATVWRLVLAVTLVFMVLVPVTNKATANPTSQNTVQGEKADTKTGSPQKTSLAGSSCCAEVSPRQHIPKLERNPLYNKGGKKTKTLRTRRNSGKSKSCQKENKKKQNDYRTKSMLKHSIKK